MRTLRVDLAAFPVECAQLREIGLEPFIDLSSNSPPGSGPVSAVIGIRIPDGESIDHLAYGGDRVLYRRMKPSRFRSVAKQLIHASQRYLQWAALNGYDTQTPTEDEIVARNVAFWRFVHDRHPSADTQSSTDLGGQG